MSASGMQCGSTHAHSQEPLYGLKGCFHSCSEMRSERKEILLGTPNPLVPFPSPPAVCAVFAVFCAGAVTGGADFLPRAGRPRDSLTARINDASIFGPEPPPRH